MSFTFFADNEQTKGNKQRKLAKKKSLSLALSISKS